MGKCLPPLQSNSTTVEPSVSKAPLTSTHFQTPCNMPSPFELRDDDAHALSATSIVSINSDHLFAIKFNFDSLAVDLAMFVVTLT